MKTANDLTDKILFDTTTMIFLMLFAPLSQPVQSNQVKTLPTSENLEPSVEQIRAQEDALPSYVGRVVNNPSSHTILPFPAT